jgi:hypothetical protein
MTRGTVRACGCHALYNFDLKKRTPPAVSADAISPLPFLPCIASIRDRASRRTTIEDDTTRPRPVQMDRKLLLFDLETPALGQVLHSERAHPT